MNNTAAFAHVAEQLRKDIEAELMSVGLLCRVFARGKSAHSVSQKREIEPGKYGLNKRLIQDCVGVRVILYFQEDIDIVQDILKKKYSIEVSSTTIDRPDSSTFAVTKHNLVFFLPEEFFRDIPPASEDFPVDRSFEVQLRTILSEGWHEVEHDLRYKRIADWKDHDDLNRSLNGVFATLETAEWSMRKIFDELAYRHYKRRKWDAMLHSSLRIRLSSPLSGNLSTCLDGSKDLARGLLRINRANLINSLFKMAPRLPTSADNVVFVWNLYSLKNEQVMSLTPRIVKETFEASIV